MLEKLYAFVMGIVEFRSDFTLSFEDDNIQEIYDAGREVTHKITLRKFDKSI